MAKECPKDRVLIMNKNHVARRYTKMVWGKFKGRMLSELPDYYIEWACVNYLDRAQQVIFKEELEYRNKYLNKQLNPKYM